MVPGAGRAGRQAWGSEEACTGEDRQKVPRELVNPLRMAASCSKASPGRPRQETGGLLSGTHMGAAERLESDVRSF